MPHDHPEHCIATLTFHEAVNYGAVLQALALQQAILNLGYYTRVLNYRSDKIWNAYHTRPSGVRSSLGWMLSMPSRMTRQFKFKRFINDYIDETILISRDELANASAHYSKVIVGSDQVWNTNITGNDFAYFLDFVSPEKRYSYAASIGLRVWPKCIERKAADLLSNFQQITVREETAELYIQKLTGIRARVVCDPVFLLSKDNWDSYVIEPRMSNKYVLLFTLGKPGKSCLRWARSQASKYGYKLVIMHFGAIIVPGAINVRSASPCEFLGWIKNAELVITSSFHAVCFSIIFERQFCWFVSNEEQSSVRASSSRLLDLLRSFGLSDCRVTSSTSQLYHIDYHTILPQITKLRLRSLEVLDLICK